MKHKKALQLLKKTINIHGWDGHWNKDQYMLGFYNALVLTQSFFEKSPPKYRSLNTEEK